MEGGEINTVELCKKVRLACAEGMSARAAAKHFNISRGTVESLTRKFSLRGNALRWVWWKP